MKKLIVLLLTFALVGAAFAQTPTLSASSTLSWGWDLDTGYTGFANTNKATISAKITYGMWALSVSSKQSFDFADADALYTGDVAVTIDADKAGTSLSYTANGLSVGVTAASKADWTANTANEYALGANASYKVGDAITVSGGVAYDAFDATKQLGGTASVAYSAAPLTVSVATDLFYDPTPKTFDADALLTVGYAVMEGLDAEADAYYSTGDDDVEVKVAVDYAVDPIEAGVSFGIADPITAIAYDLGIYAGYTYAIDAATKFYVYAEYTSDFTGKGSLVPKVSLTNTSVTNTTLKLEYNPDDADVLAGNYGKIIASAKISL